MTADEALLLMTGAVIGAALTGLCWLVDRWRNRVRVSEPEMEIWP